eukprot:TRINITY_DN12053_c0_g1_i1.p1 TRINITY_DN12053_c0_g1~~TRINITY_DN12053_c0_g1_i1.p1  ORF type:complete len:270 (+),score=13.55 TRINITY_DN12053_c0_g1_i1:112-921(+)
MTPPRCKRTKGVANTTVAPSKDVTTYRPRSAPSGGRSQVKSPTYMAAMSRQPTPPISPDPRRGFVDRSPLFPLEKEYTPSGPLSPPPLDLASPARSSPNRSSPISQIMTSPTLQLLNQDRYAKPAESDQRRPRTSPATSNTRLSASTLTYEDTQSFPLPQPPTTSTPSSWKRPPSGKSGRSLRKGISSPNVLSHSPKLAPRVPSDAIPSSAKTGRTALEAVNERQRDPAREIEALSVTGHRYQYPGASDNDGGQVPKARMRARPRTEKR